MSLGPRTSEFTETPAPSIVLPDPEVRTLDVPDGTFSNRKGFIVLAKKCDKMGYETRLTYSRGYVAVKNQASLRHCLLLRIRGEVNGEWGTVAGASWEAPAKPGDDPWLVEYKTHGALIYCLSGRFGVKELEEWLLDPNVDPREVKPVG